MGAVIESLTAATAETIGLDEAQEIGIGSFTMYAMIRRNFSLKSDVPEIPIEDGSTISDHIILKPIEISIEGSVADIFLKRNVIAENYDRLQSEIGNVSKYLPEHTTSQISKINELAVDGATILNKVDAAVEDGKQALNYFGIKSDALTLRELFQLEMERLHYSKMLVSLELPFTVEHDMRITSITFSDDNTANTTAFTLTAKKVRKAKIIFDEVDNFFKNPSSGNQGAAAGVKDKGSQTGDDAPTSLLSSVFSVF